MEREDVRKLNEGTVEEGGMEEGEAQSEADAVIEERAGMLMAQARTIVEAGGPDMLEVFRQDPVIREKVLSGEWDFQVGYGFMLGKESAGKNGRRSVPSVVRSPNNASTRKSVAGMSDKEFDALDERLSRGEVVDPSR